ncbi:MAG: bacteriocin [Bacillota bacterium]
MRELNEQEMRQINGGLNQAVISDILSTTIDFLNQIFTYIQDLAASNSSTNQS